MPYYFRTNSITIDSLQYEFKDFKHTGERHFIDSANRLWATNKRVYRGGYTCWKITFGEDKDIDRDKINFIKKWFRLYSQVSLEITNTVMLKKTILDPLSWDFLISEPIKKLEDISIITQNKDALSFLITHKESKIDFFVSIYGEMKYIKDTKCFSPVIHTSILPTSKIEAVKYNKICDQVYTTVETHISDYLSYSDTD